MQIYYVYTSIHTDNLQLIFEWSLNLLSMIQWKTGPSNNWILGNLYTFSVSSSVTHNFYRINILTWSKRSSQNNIYHHLNNILFVVVLVAIKCVALRFCMFPIHGIVGMRIHILRDWMQGVLFFKNIIPPAEIMILWSRWVRKHIVVRLMQYPCQENLSTSSR